MLAQRPRRLAALVVVLAAAPLLAGCFGTNPGTLIVVADDLVAIHGPETTTAHGDFGPHCANAVLADGALTLRFDQAERPPEALLLRKFDWTSFGPQVLTLSADRTGDVALDAGAVEVRSPLAGGPLLLVAVREGDAARLGDTLLQPGGNTSVSFSYHVPADNGTVDVEETLTFHHLGRVPTRVQQDLQCA